MSIRLYEVVCSWDVYHELLDEMVTGGYCDCFAGSLTKSAPNVKSRDASGAPRSAIGTPWESGDSVYWAGSEYEQFAFYNARIQSDELHDLILRVMQTHAKNAPMLVTWSDRASDRRKWFP